LAIPDPVDQRVETQNIWIVSFGIHHKLCIAE
jgi:hypothetical protein